MELAEVPALVQGASQVLLQLKHMHQAEHMRPPAWIQSNRLPAWSAKEGSELDDTGMYIKRESVCSVSHARPQNRAQCRRKHDSGLNTMGYLSPWQGTLRGRQAGTMQVPLGRVTG